MLSLITLTSDRPEAFALCEKWMARQTYQGKRQWIIVDDGQQKVRGTAGDQIHIAKPAGPLVESLLMALGTATGEKIIIVQDDVWYAPDYLETMAAWLDGADLACSLRTVYYDAAARQYVEKGNVDEGSLSHVGFRKHVIASWRRWIEQQDRTLSFEELERGLFDSYSGYGMCKMLTAPLALTIEGLPGKRGIDDSDRSGQQVISDANGEKLRQWIGIDADEIDLVLESVR